MMGRSILSHNNRLALILLVGFAVVFAACSDDTTAPPPNKSPTIQLVIAKWATTQQETVTFSAIASDADDDPLTVTWQVLRGGQPSGTLNAADQGSTSMRWTAPQERGVDEIVATVSDGKGGKATDTETIQVGTLRAASSLTASQIWNKTNSPYVIRPGGLAFGINKFVTLTIDAGVQVFIDKNGLDFVVNGELVTNGTDVEPVVFRPNTRDADSGDWQGITASADTEVPLLNLTGAKLLYAVAGVRNLDTSNVTLNGCWIMFTLENAVLHQSVGPLRVENCVITNNTRTGIRVSRGPGVDVPNQVIIMGDSIAVNGDLSGATPYEDDAGILIDVDDPDGLANIDISCNEISRNGVPGIQLANATYPDIHHNAIFRNELGKSGNRYNIVLAEGYGGNSATVSARENYWGAPYSAPADSVEIKLSIRDGDDGVPGVTATVIIGPWLNDWPDAICP
jgi:hypothetical protein